MEREASMTSDTQPLETSSGIQSGSRKGPRRPAAIAAARVSRAEVLLGALGLASVGFVFLRLFETWRVSPRAVSHHIVILGQSVSYPTANLAAVIVVVLALFGAAVTALMVFGAARELTTSRRFARRLAAAGRPHSG